MSMRTRIPKTTDSMFELLAKRIEHFRRQGNEKTAENYTCVLKRFREFMRDKDIPLKDLSASVMQDFQNFLTGEGLQMNTISLYNRILRAVYNYALDEGILRVNRYPFRKVFTGAEKTRKRAVEKETVVRVIGLEGLSRSEEFARDMFLFSIYTQGMPFVDIAHLTKDKIQSGCIIYQRRKTNQRIRIALHPRAEAIIRKWMVESPDCPYVFPILYNPQKEKPVKYSSALRTHNKRLARISALLELKEPLSSYVSRHTWASLARWLGISDTVISEAMGHSNIETTTVYLASLNVDVIASANRKVIDSLVNDGHKRKKFKEYQEKEKRLL